MAILRWYSRSSICLSSVATSDERVQPCGRGRGARTSELRKTRAAQGARCKRARGALGWETLQREGRARLHLRRVATVCEKPFFSSDSRRVEPNRYWAPRRTRKLAARRARSSPQCIGLVEVRGHDHWASRPPNAHAEHQCLPGGHPRVSEAAGGCAREGMAADRASGEEFAYANAARTRAGPAAAHLWRLCAALRCYLPRKCHCAEPRGKLFCSTGQYPCSPKCQDVSMTTAGQSEH